MAKHMKDNTKILLVIKNTLGCIFGSYSDTIPWSWSRKCSGHDYAGYGYCKDETAFLFSLVNPSFKPLKMKIVNPYYATFHGFPDENDCLEYGSDLVLCQSSNRVGLRHKSFVNLYSYENAFGLSGEDGGVFITGGERGRFLTEEVEVFGIL